MELISKNSVKNLGYIEVLRTIATVAVVFLHINMTLPANFSKVELGYDVYVFFECGYMLVAWAVPIFFMISGALLLNPAKGLSISKIIDYIKRMAVVLVLFGTVFAFMEIFFEERHVSIEIFFRSFLCVLEGKSWDHLWYLYSLIGLYILTIPIRYIVERVAICDFEKMLLVLSICSFCIPTLNGYLDIDLETFMLIDYCVIYYLWGYYVSVTDRQWTKNAAICFPFAIFVLILTEVLGVYFNDSWVSTNMMGNNMFRALSAISLFSIIKNNFHVGCSVKKQKIINICKKFKRYSFGIYIIHPFFINFIFKVLGITPLSGQKELMTGGCLQEYFCCLCLVLGYSLKYLSSKNIFSEIERKRL